MFVTKGSKTKNWIKGSKTRSLCINEYFNCKYFEIAAAAKGKYEIVKLLLKHGADPTKKNRDGATPLDLIREGDEDVADLLRGKAALLDAAKKGNLARVQRLVTSENINCRDSQGRNSTLLHLAGNTQLT